MGVLWGGIITRGRLRRLSIVALDSFASAVALFVAVYLRMNGDIPTEMLRGLAVAMPITAAITAIVLVACGTYRRAWRYVSINDLIFVVPMVTISIIASMLVLRVSGWGSWEPASVPVIQWFVLIVLLGTMRLVRRLVREYELSVRAAQSDAASAAIAPDLRRVLLVGSADRVEMALRSLESAHRGSYRAVGILDPNGSDLRLRLRGVPVLGTVEAIDQVVNALAARGQRPDCLLLVDGPGRLPGPTMVRLVSRAETLGLSVRRMNGTLRVDDNNSGELDLSFMDMTQLLGRPQVRSNDGVTASAIFGRRVLVTGAGGTIGAELVRQIAALKPAQLTLLDHCELNLYSIDLEMQENFPEVPRRLALCSIRQRECLMHAFAQATPELVFHAAALKHVPLVETNPCAGVLTNVIGTRNVADAALRYGVRAMVQVSTDKAVNPVGMMGATKRLGELYCQALDLAGADDPAAPRFMTVRFGNVLGSSGSLIPLLQRQLSRRAPLTVTHPEITRFFMTVHEAVQLILHSSALAAAENLRRGRIFVLDMGEPIKIIDIARRMIRLAGLEPDVDVKIDIVGLRPGEKLYEELFDPKERRVASTMPGIFEAEPIPVPLDELDAIFDRLETASLSNDVAMVRLLVAAALDTGPVDTPVPAAWTVSGRISVGRPATANAGPTAH